MECDVGVGFGNIFKAEIYILSTVSKANEMIGWMVRNFILREAYVVLKIYSILTRLNKDYCIKTRAPNSRDGKRSVILRLEVIQRRVTKMMNRIKDQNYWERWEKLGLTILSERTMRHSLIRTFKIINEIYNYDWNFYSIFS